MHMWQNIFNQLEKTIVFLLKKFKHYMLSMPLNVKTRYIFPMLSCTSSHCPKSNHNKTTTVEVKKTNILQVENQYSLTLF